MTRIGFCFLFIIATLVHYSSGSSCGVHDDYRAYIWDGSTNTSEITNITVFKYNLNIALSNFTSDEKTNIANFAGIGRYYGEDPNAAYSQVRCIGYVEDCLGCIQDAKSRIQEDCEPVTNSAILWYKDRCMVQYSNNNMFRTIMMPDDMITIENDTRDVPSSDAGAFNILRTKLFKALSDKAALRPDGTQLLAAGKWYEGSNNNTIYGVVQCSPDLESTQCASCLAIVGQKLENYFSGKVGSSIVGPSCNYRYDVKSFVDESLFVFSNLSPPTPPPPLSPPQTEVPASPSILSPPPSSPVPYPPSSWVPRPPSTGGKANKSLIAVYILVLLFIISIILGYIWGYSGS